MKKKKEEILNGMLNYKPVGMIEQKAFACAIVQMTNKFKVLYAKYGDDLETDVLKIMEELKGKL